MYRDHRKGPGGPPGGATYPGGPHGLKWEGNLPLVGWGAPLGPPPMRLGLGTLGGSFPLALGGKATPSPLGRRPPLGDSISRAGAPPGGPYKGGGREGSRTPESWRLPPPATPLPPPAVAWRSPAGVLLHPPPRRRAAGSSSTSPSPCWIKKEETSLHRTCVKRGGAVRSALGHR